ncbi:hypothetical protein [Vulcanisaeta sp. JCM 16161]|uniref:hypothetical protein n=1 Tax=Vulcanisaeta sp. JCM 16161 TaxID=1295372 RepID=UPI000A63BEA2|nr:hypothetical protein [Vulcanisaeta sp. JCM 16161]
MAPNGLRICWGRRVRGDKRLECGEEVNDERVIEEVMRLINEFINRVEKHGDVLLSESSTLFDDVINALSDWLGKIETRIGEGDDESIANLRRAMLDIGKEMLRLLKQAREKWLKTYKPELEELINKLGSGGARVIISGEPFNSNKSFVAHLYTENLVVVIARVAKMGSITVNISLIGLEGVRMVVPRLFGDNRLRAMQYGLLLTDGTIDEEGYPVMGTNQLWQAFAWLIAWPGKNHVYINGLSLNNGYVSVMWYLRAVDRRGVFESKAVVAEEAGKLDVEDFLAFLLFVALGDGDVNVKRKRARLTMGSSKVELWSDIIERLRSLGFRIDRDNGYAVAYTAKPSKAVELARKMLGYPLIKALIEDLSQLPDAEKLKQLIELSGMELNPWVGHQLRLPA